MLKNLCCIYSTHPHDDDDVSDAAILLMQFHVCEQGKMHCISVCELPMTQHIMEGSK